MTYRWLALALALATYLSFMPAAAQDNRST
jgi:hypothetical protein